MYGLVLAVHHDARFLRIPGTVDRAHRGFARLVEDYRNPNKQNSQADTASAQ
jgi:hypothetical protein